VNNVAAAARLAPIAWWLVRPPMPEKASPWELARRQHEASRSMCRMHGIDVRVTGRPTAGAALFVANHVGYFDPFVIASLTECLSVAKTELRQWPFVGRRMRELGVLFIDRGNVASGARVLRSMIRAFRLGASVLNFPEGTTSDGRVVLPFRRGAFGAARIAGVPVVPVRIDYDDPRVAWVGHATFLPHYARTMARGRIRADVTFGAPIAPVLETARELADRAHAAIVEMSPR
jgi:1-acyl-sn-glycerol-3-phosphate acyltransferase